MKNKISEAVFYHIYPLGMCGAPQKNDFCSAKSDKLNILCGELDYIKSLGVNAIYIGPLFESSSHGYDTVDYYHVDRRLGNNEDFKHFVENCHSKGISVIVDAVFNHTGRDFFAFKDLQAHGWNSQYKDWYKNIRFDSKSSFGDNFSYEGWAGHMSLVKLDTDNAAVRQHIFGAVEMWIREFNIDGLRLDAADVLSGSFMESLHNFCAGIKDNFWLMGEVVHGDYNNWARAGKLDSVTNYQMYKALWSSYNSANLFEIAYSLNEEFGSGGKYKNLMLYNFLDNHDVNRIASTLANQKWLFPLYGMLFTVPGIPSIYYGSEWGIRGTRVNGSDYQLRPAAAPFADSLADFARPAINGTDLQNTIRKFAEIRKTNPALQKGDYRQIALTNTEFAFMRTFENQQIISAFNQKDTSAVLSINGIDGDWEDILNGGHFSGDALHHLEIPGAWLRILRKL